MRLDLILATLILLGESIGSSRAELRATPRFDSVESQVISRNDLLRAIVDVDPWMVRRILDVMARTEITGPPGEKSDRLEAVDFAKNPDLAGVPKNALSSQEWLELVKRAKVEKDKREQDEPHTLKRDYSGSLEILDMMKQAKDKKSDSVSK